MTLCWETRQGETRLEVLVLLDLSAVFDILLLYPSGFQKVGAGGLLLNPLAVNFWNLAGFNHVSP